MATTPTQSTQEEALQLTSETFTFYKNQSEKHRKKMVKLFKGYNDYLEVVNTGQQTPFVVNLSAQVVEKGLPRVYAKNPNWIVTKNTSTFNIKAFSKAKKEIKEAMESGVEGLDKQLEELEIQEGEFERDMIEGVQSYLTYIFDQYDYKETLQLWAKSALLYGYAFIKTDYKHVISTEFDAKGKVIEKPAAEYPTIEVKSWSDMYVDARFQSLKEMPSIIERIEGVSLSELKRDDKLFNLDKIEDLTNLSNEITDDSYKDQIKAILGINIPDGTTITRMDKNNLDIKVYYGQFKGEGDDEEMLHKITMVNDVVVIGMEKILRYPFVAFKCFSNPEQFFGTGLSEKVQPYQDELTFKKQAFAESVNQSLYRSFYYDNGIGTPPANLRPRPGGMTKVKSVARMDEHFREQEFKPLPNEYFSEQNDLERQAENAAFQINASSPQTQSALTDTLGGVRLQAEESNSVYKMIRDNFTDAMTDLGYLLILETRDNFTSNIAIKNTNSEEFWELNKEMLRDPEIRYAIDIEANSSSFEDLGRKRENAIALGNYMTQLFQLGVVGKEAVQETSKMILNTYERLNPDNFLGLEPEQPQGQQEQPAGQPGAIAPPPQEVDEAKQEVDDTINNEVTFE